MWDGWWDEASSAEAWRGSLAPSAGAVVEVAGGGGGRGVRLVWESPKQGEHVVSTGPGGGMLLTFAVVGEPAGADVSAVLMMNKVEAARFDDARSVGRRSLRPCSLISCLHACRSVGRHRIRKHSAHIGEDKHR